jgi:hypothetical protein
MYVLHELPGNGSHEASVVQNVFCGIEQSVVKCSACQLENKIRTPMMVVQLEVRSSRTACNR